VVYRNERGQALPLLLIAMAVAMVGVLVVVRLAGAADDAARARTAADAAALAGAADGRGAASAMAQANGGELIDYVASPPFVEVVVRVGDAVARARAEQVFTWVPSGGP